MIINLQKAFESEQFQNRKTETLIPMGVDSEGNFVFEDLKDLKSIIMAGTTGSGKSVFKNVIIASLLKQNHNIYFLLHDCKRVEFIPYKDLNCLVGEVTYRTEDLKKQFKFLETELFLRSTRKKEGMDIYNNYHSIVIIIEECSDIMYDSGEYFGPIISRIAREGADLNMFVIISTSRPTDITFTKEMRESFYTQIALNLPQVEDSEKLIGQAGAEKLLGRGDMLFKKGDESPKRLQGFYISDKEVEEFVKKYFK